MTKSKKSILVLIFVVVLSSFIIWVKHFLTIDSCLDSGGRWDYEKEKCIENKNAAQIDKCLNQGGIWDYQSQECKG